MDRGRYLKMIDAAIEEPGIDFKRATAWHRSHECERFELLKHIAAMSTYGGGVLIIGREDADKHKGSMTKEQVDSFEVTAVNEYARRWLRPLNAIRVIPLEIRSDRLVVLDVPGFTNTPACFQKASDCKVRHHRAERRHFSVGDVYIRTAASQTVKLSDPDDWDHVWNQIIRNVKHSVSFAEPRTDVNSEKEYEKETQDDANNFRFELPLPNTTGILDVRIRPQNYIADRIPRLRLKPTLWEAQALLQRPQTRNADEMPWRDGAVVQNFADGVVLINNNPKWKRIEQAILHTSGSFRLRRVFPEDFNAENMIDGSDKRMALIGAMLDLTLAFCMISQLASKISRGDEVFELAVTIGGLGNRRIEDDSTLYGARIPVLLSIGPGQNALDNEITIERCLTSERLQRRQRDLAVEFYQDLLWRFGIEPSVSTVAGFQGAFTQGSPAKYLEN